MSNNHPFSNHVRESADKTLESLKIKSITSGTGTSSQSTPGYYLDKWQPCSSTRESVSPIDGSLLGMVGECTAADVDTAVSRMTEVFHEWRTWPSPQRGEIIRQLGVALRAHKQALGTLITLEMGKILPEALGEVQEMIDICDYAVGLSRQLYGKTMHSERKNHRMYEQWHPLGPVGIISAFNFPMAVWSWNAAIAAICGNPIIWKPSEHTSLCAIAVQQLFSQVLTQAGAPQISCLISGGKEVGQALSRHTGIPLVSATGSTEMGRAVGQDVAARLGRSLLELGGNNALIVSKHANLDLALRAVVFGAVGTCGQRCTTTRRLIIDSSVSDEFCKKLKNAYDQLSVGNPLSEGTLVGPLFCGQSGIAFQHAIGAAIDQKGTILAGGRDFVSELSVSGATYVKPTVVLDPKEFSTIQDAKSAMNISQKETFAPILYVFKAKAIDAMISLQNAVPQGLSSALFSDNVSEAERFLSAAGSDCGIANINIGTSGAEIGGAFGGEKDTGGGREAGSDSWKAYMRRQTVTINYGESLPLAQGIKFE